jgi:hypothetical protein
MRVIVWVLVVIAAGRTGGQSSVEERGHQFFHVASPVPARTSIPLAGEQIQGALADPARDDHLDALLTEPAWKQARLVIRAPGSTSVRSGQLSWNRCRLRPARTGGSRRSVRASRPLSRGIAIFMRFFRVLNPVLFRPGVSL